MKNVIPGSRMPVISSPYPRELLQALTNGRTNGSISPSEQRRNREHAHRRICKEKARLDDQGLRFREFEKEHDLLIPSKGIIDHCRFSLLQPLVPRDRDRLSKLGFRAAPIDLRAKRGPGDEIFDPEPGAELLLRSSDGCRVLIWPERVAVIASLSRVLGLTNDRLDELSAQDVMEAYRQVTNDLLPWTTIRAHLAGNGWAIAEIALAIDVLEDARRYADAYESILWRPVRKRPYRYKNGLVWAGSDNRLTLYDKGVEMLRRGLSHGPPPGEVMRLERQWSSCRSISRFADAIAHGHGPRVPFLVKQDGNRPFPGRFPLDFRVLHQVLAKELSLLDAPLPLAGSRVDALAAHMAECSRFHEVMRHSTDRKTYQKYRRKMLAVRQESAGLPTLLRACYGGL